MNIFFNAAAITEIYTLSLHDALPISAARGQGLDRGLVAGRSARRRLCGAQPGEGDRKSTRLNSSHITISYAVFCLKKKRHCSIAPWSLARPSAAPPPW